MSLADYIREHSTELAVEDTGLEPRLERLDIKAVLFDIYGTLMISASGDIGIAQKLSKSDALHYALEKSCGYKNTELSQELLLDTIARDHERTRALGHPFPEVNIVEIWQDILVDLHQDTRSEIAEHAAVVYECATNPVWPMPHVEECFAFFAEQDVELGIISNAQFYTPILFTALCYKELGDYGIDPSLSWYSYQSKRAKPDVWMYEEARSALENRGIKAEHVLYVGNDMLNDMYPAQQVGFKTALFAGDKRSLRMREDHKEASEVVPDCIITDLIQLRDVC